MTILEGRVSNAWTEPAESELSADAALGATVISVETAFPFDVGRKCRIVTSEYTITDVDYEADLLTISPGLVAAAVVEEQVVVLPEGLIKKAQVDLDDGGEGPICFVPYSMFETFATGLRDFEGEEGVLISDETGRWEIKSLDEEEPTIDLTLGEVRDGSFPVYDLDGILRSIIGLQEDGVYTIVEKNGPPPPAPAAPTVSVQPGLLNVTTYGLIEGGGDWPSDTRRIDVHVSLTPGFTPNFSTAVASFPLEGGMVSLALDQDTYYVKLVAVNSSDAWSDVSGEMSGTVPAPLQGEQGVPGPPGEDGQSLYTWIKYATDATGTGITNDPTGMSHIGISYNNLSAVESTDPGDYVWALIEGPPGEDGADGVPGPPGADGTPRYTWIKYADNISGSGLSNSPVGKTYIGLAYNKTTATESTNPIDYEWALFQGPGKIYRTSEPPTGLTTGDEATWYDTNNDNKPYFWDGDTWEPAPFGPEATTATILANKRVPLDTAMSLEWGVPNPAQVVSSSAVGYAGWRVLDKSLNGHVNFGYSSVRESGGVYFKTVFLNYVNPNGYEAVVVGSDGTRVGTGIYVANILDSYLDLCQIGTTWYVMISYPIPGGGGWRTMVRRYDSSWNFLGSWKIDEATKSYSLGENGTNLLLGRTATSIQVRNPTTGALSSTITLSAAPASSVPLSIDYGVFDTSASTRIAVLFSDFTNKENVYMYTTAGAAQAAEHWQADPAAIGGTGVGKIYGLSWSATHSRWLADTLHYGVRISSSNTTTGTVWVSYSWYNTALAYETAAAPVSTIGLVVERRSGIELTYFTSPVDIDEDPAPDTIRVFGYTGASQPALSSLRRMTTLPDYLDASEGWFTELPFSRGANAPPTVSTFPASGDAGIIESEYGGFWVDGQGQGQWPYLKQEIINAIAGSYAKWDHTHNDLDSRIRRAGPVGITELWYGAKEDCPVDYVVLDGTTYSSSVYPELFEHLGTTTLPNMEDKVPMGASGTKAVKSTGGADSVTLTNDELPSHTHQMAHTHPVPRKAGVGSSSGYARGNGTSDPNDSTNAADPNVTDARGNGLPFSIVPKYMAFHYIMRARSA